MMITRIPSQTFSASTRHSDFPRALQRYSNHKPSQHARSLLQQAFRQYSTTETPASGASRPNDLRSQFQPVSQPNPSPKPKRSLRRYIYATLFLMFGLTAGQYVRMVVSPPPLPLPGTKEDILMVEYLIKQAEKLPIVQSLSTDAAWESYDAYQHSNPETKPHDLSTGPLGGARAIGGFQRIFHNKESGEIVNVVWFGGAIAGWPGVTHGGISATIMDETLGRCAIHQFPSRTGVTANLNLNYLKPAVTNSFYIIRAIPEKEGATDTKQWVYGRLETVDGRVCVEARGLFVVPKKFMTKSIVG